MKFSEQLLKDIQIKYPEEKELSPDTMLELKKAKQNILGGSSVIALIISMIAGFFCFGLALTLEKGILVSIGVSIMGFMGGVFITYLFVLTISTFGARKQIREDTFTRLEVKYYKKPVVRISPDSYMEQSTPDYFTQEDNDRILDKRNQEEQEEEEEDY